MTPTMYSDLEETWCYIDFEFRTYTSKEVSDLLDMGATV